MGVEIERKFTVDLNKLGPLPNGKQISQGYIPTQGLTTVRVRIMGDEAFLCIKGGNRGHVRSEFEYPIPLADARELLDQFCQGATVEKTRYLIGFDQHTWELDIFEGANKGLVIAEIELQAEDEDFSLPPWVLSEVSSDARYYNANLLKHPYQEWVAD